MDDIMKHEIESWMNEGPVWVKFFQNRHILTILKFCDLVTFEHPRREELIKDFILGLAGLRFSNMPNMTVEMEACNKLMMPVFNIGGEIVKSDDYKYDFLKSYVPGNVEIRNGNVVSKITAKALFNHIKGSDTLLLTENNLDELELDYIRRINKRYSTVANSHEQHAFQTNLTDKERLKLCNEIIQNNGLVKDFDKKRKGKASELDVFTGITEEHLKTLIYLFGGEKPTRIKKIRMKSHNSVYKLLLKYSSSMNWAGSPKLTDDFRKKFCPTVLCNRYGKTIPELHKLVKDQE